MPAKAAFRGERGWIPAFAGMTEAYAVNQIGLAHLFSRGDMKSTKGAK
jgi:hypothetical protein